jgi:RNA polymerase sigma-70 factor, ECF subfamily
MAGAPDGAGREGEHVSRDGHDRMSPELAERFERDALPYQGQLLRAALQLTKHRQDAEDLVQESIARACAAFHRFTPDTNVRAWMHRIMLNTFINGYRKRQREPFLSVPSVGELAVAERFSAGAASISAEDAALSKIPTHSLVAALQDLPEEFRQVLYLIDVEGFSYRETAAIMTTPLGTVMSRLHRARASLRARLLSEHGNNVFESPEQGERMGTRHQEDPHVQRHNGNYHRDRYSRDRADHCHHDDGTEKAAAAALRP